MKKQRAEIALKLPPRVRGSLIASTFGRGGVHTDLVRRLLIIAALLSIFIPQPLLAAQQQEFDFDNSAFWSKTYRFPERYTTVQVTLQAKDPNQVAQEIAEEFKREGAFLKTGFRTSWVWDVSSDTGAVVKKLEHFGKLTDFLLQGQVAAQPELYFKRDHLRSDSATASKILEQAPAIKGLVDIELKTLDRLISLHEHAAAGIILTIDVIGPEETDQLMPPGIGGPGRRTARQMRAMKRARHSGIPGYFFQQHEEVEGADYWNRIPTSSGCAAFALQYLHVTIKDSAVERPKVDALLKKMGAVDGPAACRSQLGVDTKWITDPEVRDLQKAVAQKIVFWEFQKPPGAGAEPLQRQIEKRVALQNDLRRVLSDLASVRYIIALTRAEIARLTIPEDPVTRGRVPVLIDFQD